MTSSLSKKVVDLEAAFWAKATYIETPVLGEVIAFIQTVSPLDTPINGSWFANNAAALKAVRRIERIENTLPPIHPAFLPNYKEIVRRMQWGFYIRPGYRELNEKTWTQFLEYARSRYDVKEGGLLGVSLRLYEKDIDQWIVEREYIGRSSSREEYASEMIELWKILKRESKKSGYPQEKKARDEIWRRAGIESTYVLYGREMTKEELEFDYKMWAQLREDMAAGKPASESEAARYLRDLFDRYPRKAGTGSSDA